MSGYNPNPGPVLERDAVKATLETAPTVNAAIARLKTSGTRLRNLCRGDDELRPLLYKLIDKGKKRAQRGMGKLAFTAVPGGLYLGPR